MTNTLRIGRFSQELTRVMRDKLPGIYDHDAFIQRQISARGVTGWFDGSVIPENKTIVFVSKIIGLSEDERDNLLGAAFIDRKNRATERYSQN